MVKQRNIFEPERIDILSDKDKPAEEVTPAKLIIEAFNNGHNVTAPPKSKRKGHSDLPLFKPEQTNLF